MRELGATGVRVPILGLGTAGMGTGLRDDAAERLLNEAVDLGVTYIDTAPALGGYGRAQQQIGRALQGRRSEIFVVTKCYEPDGDGALRLLESNLRELRMESVDLVYAHSIGADKMVPEVAFGSNGVLRALQRFKEEGLTRFVGVSGHNRPKRFVRALQEHDLDVVMTAVNFVDAHTYDFEGRVWPVARGRNVGLVAMKVFGGVRRGRALMPDEQLDAAFRYALSLEGCATAVIGMVSRDELQRNVERAHSFQSLTPAELTALQQTGRQLAGRWGPHFGPVE
jgi:aryl-alcohol dehydrogenase-like predicted oxidoreductase